MVTHYSTNGSDSACGRTSPTLVSTQDADQVSCKSCQRSLVKPEVAQVKKTPSLADLRKKPAPAAAPKRTPVTTGGFCFKAGWRARLTALPSTCRLPRGVAGQAFV